jgi:predicted enzyme related to lactoylglutathione lyase
MAKRAKARPNKQSAARRPPARVKPIPVGYHAVTASLTVRDAARALDFYKGTTVGLFLYGRDVDGAFKRATGAGCTVLKAPEDMFEDVPPKEMARRAQAAMASMPGAAS